MAKKPYQDNDAWLLPLNLCNESFPRRIEQVLVRRIWTTCNNERGRISIRYFVSLPLWLRKQSWKLFDRNYRRPTMAVRVWVRTGKHGLTASISFTTKRRPLPLRPRRATIWPGKRLNDGRPTISDSKLHSG